MIPNHISTWVAVMAATALTPLSTLADTFDAQSRVTSATLYPNGAQVTRQARIALPAGRHEVSFFDIPAGYAGGGDNFQTRVSGAALGPTTLSVEEATAEDRLDTKAARDAYAIVETLESRLDAAKRAADAIDLEATAAEDTLAFLSKLTAPDGATPEILAATALMIREQSLAARLAVQDAKVRAEQARKDFDALVVDLDEARLAFERVANIADERLRVTLEVTLDAPDEVEVTFVYDVRDAGWMPTYKASVDTVQSTLKLDRNMRAVQDTGEPWVDIDLSFSTEQPNRRAEPTPVYEYVRRITDPLLINNVARMDAEMAGAPAKAMMAAPAMEDTATPQSYGLNLTYHYDQKASLYASNEGATDFALSPLELTPDLYVRAVPLFEQTGYLIADVENTSGEVIVPGDLDLYRDGALIGHSYMQTRADGAEFEMAFGPVDGIRVNRVLINRNEGDRGLISKSNEASSSARLEVENLTDRSWPIALVDRVSVSEQEDLKVSWEAVPMPTEVGADDRRGVLLWRFELGAGAQTDVTLTETLRWPEGKILR